MTYDQRHLIDPDNRYPADGLRGVERMALEVLQVMHNASVSRTRDVIQLEWGDENGIVVLVTSEAIELRLPTIEWTAGSYGPAMASRLWKRVDWDDITEGGLPKLLKQAQAARNAEFAPCVYCGERFSPDRMTGEACHGCASKHLGIVY